MYIYVLYIYVWLYTLDGRHGESGLCSEYARFLVWMIKTLMIFIHFSEIKHASFGAGKWKESVGFFFEKRLWGPRQEVIATFNGDFIYQNLHLSSKEESLIVTKVESQKTCANLLPILNHLCAHSWPLFRQTLYQCNAENTGLLHADNGRTARVSGRDERL